MSARTDVNARTDVEPVAKGRLLLINPKITARRHARFPLSIMTIAAALEDSHESMLIDGNVDGAACAPRATPRAPSASMPSA